MPWLSEAEREMCEHQIDRLRIEVRWHERLRDTIAKIADEGD